MVGENRRQNEEERSRRQEFKEERVEGKRTSSGWQVSGECRLCALGISARLCRCLDLCHASHNARGHESDRYRVCDRDPSLDAEYFDPPRVPCYGRGEARRGLSALRGHRHQVGAHVAPPRDGVPPYPDLVAALTLFFHDPVR